MLRPLHTEILASSARRGTLLWWRARHGGLLDRNSLALALGLLGGCVPVVDHLDGEDGVEEEAGDEAVED